MKAVCTILVLFFCYCSYARHTFAPQQTDSVLIGKCMDGTAVHASLAFEANNSDTTYTLSLRNLQNSNADSYHSISFSGGSKTLSQFYQAIKQMIAWRDKKHRDRTVTIALGSKLIVIETTRILGVTTAILYLPEGYNTLTALQADKVFGKI